MKDLKENIQKNNIKKLVLSVALGMFCYCTNNAMEDPQPEKHEPEKNKEIKEVLTVMLESQVGINKAREEIKDYEKTIYCRISEETKVTKKNVLDFIINIYTQDEQNEKGFQDNINKIEQYFHLEEIKNDNDECKDENLTETFWEKVEEGEAGEIGAAINEDEKKTIKQYFNTIIKAENDLSTVFKSYYNAIKTKKEKANEAAKYEDILGEIMKDCCGEETKSYPVTNFIKNLKNLWEVKNENVKKNILLKIKRRITLSDNVQEQEQDFISFIKQKIEPLDEKEGGCSPCCPCCDCLKKNKNPEEDPQEEKQ